MSSGHDREYLLHVPKSYDRTKPTPLVITLHPAMNWPAFVAKLTRWNDVADENLFIVAYPAAAGHGPRAWLDGKPRLPMDVRFVSDLIDTLQASYNIDPARIYAARISQGGGVLRLVPRMPSFPSHRGGRHRSRRLRAAVVVVQARAPRAGDRLPRHRGSRGLYNGWTLTTASRR